jgi:UDP-N-acetyl-D-mannosaminuronate dehydrogenase
VTGPVAVVGLGEVGRPLFQLIEGAGRRVIGIDVDTVALPRRGSVEVMHVCFPFEIPDFVGEVARYVDLLDPAITVVNSTVAVGTTRAIHEGTGTRIAHSPVRGKHSRMLSQLAEYTKYVGGIDADTASQVAHHFQSLGVPTTVVSSPEAAELAKLTETTYFGLLIAWAQEVERYCNRLGVDYTEVVSFYDEVPFFPPVTYFPGVIGGHCVMPNLEILAELDDSPLLGAIRWSNETKLSEASRVRRERAGRR